MADFSGEDLSKMIHSPESSIEDFKRAKKEKEELEASKETDT